MVQVAGTASRIAAARFRKAAEDSQAIRDIIVRYGEMLLIQVQQTAACNALHDVEERLSRWLLQARDRVDGNTIRLTHEFLSQMLGVRRPTVTVVARMLQDAGLIRYHRGHIEIVDRRGLEARACECYEAIRRQIDKSRRRRRYEHDPLVPLSDSMRQLLERNRFNRSYVALRMLPTAAHFPTDCLLRSPRRHRSAHGRPCPPRTDCASAGLAARIGPLSDSGGGSRLRRQVSHR